MIERSTRQERYAEVLRFLEPGPSTIKQLLKDIPLERSIVSEYLVDLERQGKTERVGFGRETVWALAGTVAPSAIQSNRDLVANYMEGRRHVTYRQLADALGFSYKSAMRAVQQLRDEKQAYLSKWLPKSKDRPSATKCFSLGNKPDAPKKGRMPCAERCRRARIKLLQDKERHEAYKLKERTRKLVNRMAARGDTNPLSLAWMGKLPAQSTREAA